MLFRSDRKSTRLNSSHTIISYAVFCLKKKKAARTRTGASAGGKGAGQRGCSPASAAVRRACYGRRLPVGRPGAPRAGPIFFFNDTATTEIYTLSLHDALPI